MSLKIAVTEKVNHEVLTKVITLLSSASAPLTKEAVDSVVSATLESFKGFLYASNNDLGLCVDRLLESCYFKKISDTVALEAQYQDIRTEDKFVSELIGLTAHGIAVSLTTPLYDLRHIIPQEAKFLSEEIMKKVPSVEAVSRTPLRHFSWGKLGTDTGRTTAMMLAKDRVSCFKRSTTNIYDVESILLAIPMGDTKAVTGASEVRKKFIEALTLAVTERTPDGSAKESLISNIPLAVDVILNPITYRRWTTTNRMSLAGKKVAQAVVEVTDTIDAVEDILRLINTTMLTTLGDNSSVAAAGIVENLDTVFSNIQLLRAAMIPHKDHTLADRILLTNNVVQDQVLQSFKSAGGTEDVILDYVSYVKLNEHITIPNTGVSADTIYTMREKTGSAVKKHEARVTDMASAERAIMLQESLIRHLNLYNENMIQQQIRNINNRQEEHVQNRHRALASLRSKPLEDIAVEYLVAMRDNSIVKTLFDSMNTELHSLARRENTITKTGISHAICSAIASTLLTQLGKKFGTKVVA